mmetsp:Transcript_4283/g.11619  ORF Transcript_4283/g.11619 Transcript_4283/m.11619 type:complete len:267 (+) Transcript_4283:977-1777(+)
MRTLLQHHNELPPLLTFLPIQKILLSTAQLSLRFLQRTKTHTFWHSKHLLKHPLLSKAACRQFPLIEAPSRPLPTNPIPPPLLSLFLFLMSNRVPMCQCQNAQVKDRHHLHSHPHSLPHHHHTPSFNTILLPPHSLPQHYLGQHYLRSRPTTLPRPKRHTSHLLPLPLTSNFSPPRPPLNLSRSYQLPSLINRICSSSSSKHPHQLCPLLDTPQCLPWEHGHSPPRICRACLVRSNHPHSRHSSLPQHLSTHHRQRTTQRHWPPSS